METFVYCTGDCLLTVSWEYRHDNICAFSVQSIHFLIFPQFSTNKYGNTFVGFPRTPLPLIAQSPLHPSVFHSWTNGIQNSEAPDEKIEMSKICMPWQRELISKGLVIRSSFIKPSRKWTQSVYWNQCNHVVNPLLVTGQVRRNSRMSLSISKQSDNI